MEPTEQLRVGLCGIGLEAYWGQFVGLKSKLEGYVDEVAARIRRPGLSVVNLGLVDTPIGAREAVHKFRAADLDLLFIYITTYAVSSIVLPLVQRAGAPAVVLNLQPDAAIDYAAFNQLRDRTAMTGSWLEYCSACPAPEIANLMQRAKIPFRQVTGTLRDDQTWSEIDAWLICGRGQECAGFKSSGTHGTLLQRHAGCDDRCDADCDHFRQSRRDSGSR